jgi:hypothetical protein
VTQILSCLTRDYVLLVADNLLTYGDGPRVGQVYADQECKLVSLCHTCGIGYTGLARLGGMPTHEWIAMTLARGNCTHPREASELLGKHAPQVVQAFPLKARWQTFLIAGWALFGDPPVLRPHFGEITNCKDAQGAPASAPQDSFFVRSTALPDDRLLLWHSIGQPLFPARTAMFDRKLRRLAEKAVSPKIALALMVEEIQHTATHQRTVGENILAFCIPRASVEQSATRGTALVGSAPLENVATFSYFDPIRKELLVHAPTSVCGESAMTITTRNDPSRPFQSIESRLLHVPKKRTLR